MKNDLSRFTSLCAVLFLAWAMTGCGSSTPQVADLDEDYEAQKARISELEKEIQASERARRDAESEIKDAQRDAEKARKDAERALAAAQSGKASGSGASAYSGAMVPSEARPGECYARVLVPPVLATDTEQVMVKEAAERIEVVPASYDWDEETVEVKEGTYQLEVVPATYEWIEERVMVKPKRKELQIVPAKYDTVTEKILVSPARTYWKKGRGLQERVDNNTGEIMCLVEEPAVYKTVTRQVVATPESVREVELPAEYSTIKRMVVKEEATTRRVKVPAEYETVKVLKEAAPPKEATTVIPAEYRTITKETMVEASRLEWRRVLCETNMTNDLVRSLQKSLKERGHDPGPIDGRYGPLTQAAVRSFQKSKGLATGGLTYGTIEALNVRM